MKKPAVTILMAVHNSMSTLDVAIRSIRNQTFDAWELLLVDDASKDNLHPYISQLDDQRIRLVRNSSNLGLATSLNCGIDLVESPYIARMDADDVCYPRRLEIQYDYLRNHQRVDVVGSNALAFENSGNALGVMTAAESHELIWRARLRGAFPLFHPTWMGKTGWFRQHKYDPCFLKAQDYELLLRAAPSSSYANIGKILLGYRFDQSSLRKRLKTRRYVLMALAKNSRMDRGDIDFWSGALMTCAKLIGDVVFAARKTTLTEKLRLMPVSPHEIEVWKEVWRMATS